MTKFQDYRVMTWDWRFASIHTPDLERRLFRALKRERVHAAFKSLVAPGWAEMECIWGNVDPDVFLAMGLMEGKLRRSGAAVYSSKDCEDFEI